MTPNRDEGRTYTPVAANVVEPAVVAKLPPRERVVWRLDRANGHARLAEPPPALAGWVAPFAPTIGVSASRRRSIRRFRRGRAGRTVDPIAASHCSGRSCVPGLLDGLPGGEALARGSGIVKGWNQLGGSIMRRILLAPLLLWCARSTSSR
ncbi:MAG: hypothetical protein WAV18_28740 [Roseiarcus sp.]